MLTEKDLTLIGTVGRKHGTRGEVRLQLTQPIIDADGDVPDCLFIQIDGLPVPYFIDEWRERGTETLLVKFDDVDSDEEATKLTGNDVFALTADLNPEDAVPAWKSIEDYTIQDQNGNPIGKVNDIDARNDNVLLYVETPQKNEIILPFHEDLVIDIDHTSQYLRLQIPEGLLGLND